MLLANYQTELSSISQSKPMEISKVWSED